MKEYQSLSHTRWDCKYHVVFIPKRRKQMIFSALRKHLGEIFHELARQRESQVVEEHLMRDHVHMCVSIPPKHSVSNVVGYIYVNQKSKQGKARLIKAAASSPKMWESKPAEDRTNPASSIPVFFLNPSK